MNTINAPEELDGIAIIGMVCRYPDANTIDEFWTNLINGKESIRSFTDEELLSSGVKPAALKAPNYVRRRAVIEDIDQFDAYFFGFTPRAAEATDPQQRIFLECAYQALETAGYDPSTYPGAIGVYAGVTTTNYLTQIYERTNLREVLGDTQLEIGNDKDFLTTMVSYKLNLRGPSISVNTACSASLVAVSLGCQSLWNYQTDMVLAGGVSINIPQKLGYFYQVGGVNSSDGYCRAFDAKAQGTVAGNGAGIVVLKRLSEAIADGDHIHAVIKGSAINNDGSNKVGFTAPSIEGQAEVIAMAQAVGNVHPESITYVETHGTATTLGDPIEIAALSKVFRASTDKKQFCAVGSVKTNVGHLDTAAGVAGLMKAALALENKLIPASLHYEKPNPKIDFANSPFFVNAELRPWIRNGTPLRAGVSSFGFGGTNAHVVLEEAPEEISSGPGSGSQLLVLSAKTATSLEQATQNLARHLREHPEVKLADVAYTCAVGRRAFECRRAVVCRDVDDAVRSLESRAEDRMWSRTQEAGYRPVHFLFSGQGSQQVNMGRQLYEERRVYRETVDRCASVITELTGLDVLAVLYPPAGEEATAREQLKQTEMTQVALFITEYALVKQLEHWGVTPQGMLGHSLGEFVAACVSGVLSEKDALRLVAARGRLMQQLDGGAMLAVGLGEKEVREVARDRVSIAAINGEEITVVSGTAAAIAELEAELKEQEVWHRRLETSHAFHSKMMEPMLEEYRAVVEQLELRQPERAYVSSVTGTWITGEEVQDVDYWVSQVTEPVRFWEGLKTLHSGGESIVLEVGPGKGLSGLARAVWGKDAVVVSSLGVKSEENPLSEAERVSAAVGHLWLGGVKLDWNKYYGEERRARLPLPTYPFERQSFWADSKKNGHGTQAKTSARTNADLADWFYVPSWKQSLNPPPLNGHTGDQKLRWLLFDDNRLGPRMRDRLQHYGHDVIVVQTGEEFAAVSDDRFVINPKNEADYTALFRKLGERDKSPQRIVHLWNVSSANQGQTSDNFTATQATGFHSLLSLAQTLKGQENAGPISLTSISSSIHEVIGDEILCPEKATALGISRIANPEFAPLNLRTIDLSESDLDALPEEQLVNQLLAELLSESSDQVVAYRHYQRWVQSLQPIRVNGNYQQRVALREGGVYLITGELGSPALKLASYLAKTVNAKLTVVHPRSAPTFEEWTQWQESYPDTLFLQAEADRLEAMQTVLDQTGERFGALNGVIHMAPTGTTQNVSPAEYERHLSTRRRELFVLEEVLRERQLDFCFLISSLTPKTGDSESIFSAADAHFLNSFARKVRRSALTPWIVLGWQVKTAGENGGSAFAITPDDAMEAFRRVTSLGSPPQVFVSPVNLETALFKEIKPVEVLNTDTAPKADLVSQHARPNLRSEYVTPRNEQEQIIVEVWKELLGLRDLGVHDNFFELGGHSLLAIQVARRLSGSLNTRLSPDRLLKNPTVAGLAESIANSKSSAETDYSPAVPMQTGGSKRPFFCVHPIGGGIFCFRDLVRYLGPDQPFYGMQARELSAIGSKGDPYTTLHELAADYVKAVRAVQPVGPYLIGGYSWGAIVAFEMAHQLTSADQKIPLLVVMDTPPPEVVGRIAGFDDATLLLIIARDLGHQRGKELPVKYETLQGLEGEAKFNYVYEELRKANILTTDVSQTWLRDHMEGYRARMTAANNYTSRVYTGPITLFRANEIDAAVEEHFDETMKQELLDPSAGWQKLSTLPVEVHYVPGNHSVIVAEPNVRVLAEKLTDCINRAEKE